MTKHGTACPCSGIRTRDPANMKSNLFILIQLCEDQKLGTSSCSHILLRSFSVSFLKPLLLPDLKSSHMPTARAQRVNTRWRKQIQPKIKHIYFTYKTDKKELARTKKKSIRDFFLAHAEPRSNKHESVLRSQRCTGQQPQGGCDSYTGPSTTATVSYPLSRLNSLGPSFRIPYSLLFISTL
jgi:hypothetical protein